MVIELWNFRSKPLYSYNEKRHKSINEIFSVNEISRDIDLEILTQKKNKFIS